MAWTVELNQTAERQFRKLDFSIQKRIRDYIRERLMPADDPRDFGKALVGEFEGLWRYRIGDYRVICSIEDDNMVIVAVAVGHRRNIYDRPI